MSKILAIDDKRDNLLVLEAYLNQYLPSQELITAQSGKEGIEKAVSEQPDVILLDISMPGMDGYMICQELKKNQKTANIPIIMLTAIYTDIESKIKGLETGADAYIYKPFQAADLISQIKVMLRIKKAEDLLRREKELLEEMVVERTYALEDAQRAAVETIARILAIKDPQSSGNQYQIAQLSEAIGKKLGLSKMQLEGLWHASLINNIGKLSIPADILNKPGELTDVEFSFVKQHCTSAYEMLKDLPYPWPIAKIILQHHENIDGTGYPEGLEGEDILLEARILRVSDTVVAMLSHRPYRLRFTLDEVMEELAEKRKIYYDARVADICIGLLKEDDFYNSIFLFTDGNLTS